MGVRNLSDNFDHFKNKFKAHSSHFLLLSVVGVRERALSKTGLICLPPPPKRRKEKEPKKHLFSLTFEIKRNIWFKGIFSLFTVKNSLQMHKNYFSKAVLINF